MIGERLGEGAALATALLWAVSYTQFALAVRRLGASALNRLRLLVALAFLLIAHVALYGRILPRASAQGWLWLSLSGVIGFALSDAFLFRALFHLGPHRTSLVMSLIPVTSALLAWWTLGERLSLVQALAAVATLSGIVWVLSARGPARSGSSLLGSSRRMGVLFALGAVCSQSLRYILSLQGMRSGLPPLSANTAQILAATLILWTLSIARGAWADDVRSVRDRSALRATVAGAAAGPFLGVTLSMVALLRAPVGVASTLMAMSPVFLLFVSKRLFGEAISLRAAIGTGIAVGGVAALFLL